MRVIHILIGWAIQLSFSYATKPRPEPEDGICALSGNQHPPHTICQSTGSFPPITPSQFSDLQTKAVTTFNQCADMCWAEAYQCVSFVFDYSAPLGSGNQCIFFFDTLYNNGFVPDPNGNPNLVYSDRICYKCPCCSGITHPSMLDKPFFESPASTGPNSSPWIRFPFSPQPAYPTPGGNSVILGSGTDTTHVDAFESGPYSPPGGSTFRGGIGQHLHVCRKHRYVIDFDYWFDKPTKTKNATLQLFAGDYSGAVAIPNLSSSPIFTVVLSVSPPTNVGIWKHVRTCAFTPLTNYGYAQFDGLSQNGKQGFRLDNIRFTCATKKDKDCRPPRG